MAGVERSPNYPSLTLQEAIERTRRIYDKFGRRTLTSEDAFTAMGYKSASGTAKSHLGALRAYGLLDASKGTLRVSERAMRLMMTPSDSFEYVTEARAAALEPGIFRDLYETKQDEGDGPLRRYLVIERKFREDGANRLLKVYRDTLSFAGLDKAGYAPGMSSAIDTKQEPAATEPPHSVDTFVDRETGHVGEYLVKVPLAKGISATVSIEAYGGSATIRPVHIDRLAEYLKLAKHAIVDDEDGESVDDQPDDA